MSSNRGLLEVAREFIKEKRYNEARAVLEKIDDPIARQWLAKLDARDRGGALPDGVTEAERVQARGKSYTAHAIIVLVLYFVLVIPGVIANVLFHEEAKRMEKIAGKPLPGVGALGLMRKLSFLSIILFGLLIVFLIVFPLIIR